jgi:hypothetical protein
MEQDRVSKLSDAEKNVWGEDKVQSKNVKPRYNPSYADRWAKVRATKTVVFWVAVGAIIVTMLVGFNWGGWVTGGSAQKMMNDAVVQRLSSICVAQFNQDPQKGEKTTAFQETSSYQRDDYVKAQGWATMPGDQEPDNKIVDECTKQLVRLTR